MKTPNCLRPSVLGLLLASLGLSQAQAQIDVLWYGVDSSYNASITSLASTAHTYDPLNNGSLSWNLTFWNAADPTPTFSNYDVLVIGSSNQGFFGNFNSSRLLAEKTAIAAARGSRTFLSGQDADWHYINSPGPIDNGPRGFLINAVNWAASGSGLGVVALADGYSGWPNGWMTNTNSFLYNELVGKVVYFQEESVVIPGSTAGFPVNEGLTTAGLSNWGTSSHMGFIDPVPGYLSINDSGNTNYVVTIVTEGQAGGGTTGKVPDSGTSLGLLALAMGAIGFLRRKLG